MRGRKKTMGIETKMDKIVESADLVYSTAADRAVERMEEAEGNVEKDIETGKKLVDELKSNS